MDEIIEFLEPKDIASLGFEATTLAVTNFGLYLSLLSGYLFVAYLAGRNLKNSQALLINAVFAISSTYFAFSYLINILNAQNFNRSFNHIIGRGNEATMIADFFLGFAVFVFIGMLIAIPFSIRFMSEIRKTEIEKAAGT